tara:strand:+ start:3695 stop:3871 length:177 start_codon:yes stop_codon:yes gene_type:complete
MAPVGRGWKGREGWRRREKVSHGKFKERLQETISAFFSSKKLDQTQNHDCPPYELDIF